MFNFPIKYQLAFYSKMNYNLNLYKYNIIKLLLGLLSCF
jgi:hypothetical protein